MAEAETHKRTTCSANTHNKKLVGEQSSEFAAKEPDIYKKENSTWLQSNGWINRDPIWKRRRQEISPMWHLNDIGWTVLRYCLQRRGLSGWWWDCLFWVTFQLGHRGELCINTHSQSECVFVCLRESSVCVGVRALAGGEPRGPRLIPPVIGFWSGPCSSVSAN